MEDIVEDIAFEAGCHQHSYCNPKHPDLDGWIISQDKLDKFTKAIITDCIWEVIKDNQVPQAIQVLIADRIREHFGVEK